jgi:putative ABC transport system permease protein
LILSVLVVSDQLKFIKEKDLGVSVENVFAIPFSENPDAFENQLRLIKDVNNVGYSQRLPVNTLNYDGRIVSLPGKSDVIPVESCFASENFFTVYGMSLMTGRFINDNIIGDSNKFVINAAAMRTFGWNKDNAVGQQLTWSGHMLGEVIGVVKDFHLESVHEEIPPVVILKAVEKNSWQRNFISLKIEAQNEQQTLAKVESLWRSLNPQGAFTFVSMEESFEQLHAKDFQFESIIFYFTCIAIFISAIGMFALASYAAERKRKEIGIRKVLGSTVGRMAIQLCKPFILLTVAACVVAVPIVILSIDEWLATFAYHTSIRVSTILLGGGAILLLMILSMLKQLLGAALVNPVKYLRDE